MFSSWSRIQRSTPPRAAGGWLTLRADSQATRPCTRPAFPATRLRKIATMSSPTTHLNFRRQSFEPWRERVATYIKHRTALLVIDPYNDFISEGGKLWDRLKAVAKANSCVPHMLHVLNAARKVGLRVFYALHHRYRTGDYETWQYIRPIQKPP